MYTFAYIDIVLTEDATRFRRARERFYQELASRGPGRRSCAWEGEALGCRGFREVEFYERELVSCDYVVFCRECVWFQ